MTSTDIPKPHAPDHQVPDHQVPAVRQGGPDNDLLLPLIGWGTYIVGWGLIGIVIAYIDRKNVPPQARDNYTYMIRTFWIGCAYVLGAFVLAGLFFLASAVIHTVGLVLAGIAMWGLPVLTAIWFLARCIKGIVLAVRRQPIADPLTWLV